MTINVRYWLLTLLLALAGGFLVVETQAFAPSTAVAIAFAVAIGVTVVALAAVFEGRRRGGRVFVWLPGAAVLVGAWTIVAMNIFPTLTEKWLAFASGLGVLGLALVALTIHELRTERVVHSIEIREHAGTSKGSISDARPREPVGSA
jgi:peptidoglycan/LPS O-acetylase OafA/YrhL